MLTGIPSDVEARLRTLEELVSYYEEVIREMERRLDSAIQMASMIRVSHYSSAS